MNRKWVDALRISSDSQEVADLEDIFLAERGDFGPNGTYIDSPFVYAAPAGVITSRLNLSGYHPAACRSELVALIRLINDGSDEVELSPQKESSEPCRLVSADYVLTVGLEALQELRQDGVQPSDIAWDRLACLQCLEPWLYEDKDVLLPVLALQLEHVDPGTPVELDLHELFMADYFTEAEDITSGAWAKLAELTSGNGPIIVVTEGKSDARYISKTLAHVYPDLTGYFRFLDFETKYEGGTDQVVRTLRSLAAVGVMNRVIGVLDNDGAGAKAMKDLERSRLPNNIRFIMLPDVPYAEDYPTQEGISANVNGRAASIEFMFGPAVLRAIDGAFIPVQWAKDTDAVKGHGNLSNKSLAKANIDKLLKQPASQLEGMNGVWEHMCTLSSALLTAATPPRFPGQELT
ncbi:hypothetical protein PA27867_2087 [Cryobacterium arcticum]|uniref:HEPN/Toprim N-terminal domain-containing protein n=1 Tax=Cryobacterium arcticum TaxID=670052 RepID=A0A1B1BK35_9MICO|nr:hypothetical protein PA27867_2087 [Cryobacterium arcticum]